MPTYNYKARELIAKIVYYGPGRCGKTTNLQQIHAKMRPETRSDLLSVATQTDRTIYFDLLPLNLGTISGMKFMVRLFTVPGQVYYSETRKLVLRGADAAVFVADSQNHMLDENRRSLKDLKENLTANGLDYGKIPLVLQYNKRDLPELISEAELDAALNDRGVRAIPAVASQGDGVLETLRVITLEVFNSIKSGGRNAFIRASQGTPPSGLAASTTTDAVQLASRDASRPAPPQGWTNALQAAQQRSIARNDAGRGAAPQSATPQGARAVSVAGPAFPSEPPPLRHDPSPPQRATIGTEILLDEFKNLAVMHSQMAERLAVIEREVARLGRESQEIRNLLARSG